MLLLSRLPRSAPFSDSIPTRLGSHVHARAQRSKLELVGTVARSGVDVRG